MQWTWQPYKYSYILGPYIQMRDLAIKHLKYWFRISSILERTKNSTKTSNTSFERSDSGLSKSWRLGAWHSYSRSSLEICVFFMIFIISFIFIFFILAVIWFCRGTLLWDLIDFNILWSHGPYLRIENSDKYHFSI